MPDTDKGLYKKYEIKRVDGKPGRENCQYFVLDLCHDPYARQALEAYMKALPPDYALLKSDLSLLLDGAKFDHDTNTFNLDEVADKIRENVQS